VSIWWWSPIVLVLLVWLAARGGRLRRAVGRLVERKLRGYRHEVEPGNPALPREIRGEAPKVAVLGAGLAGIGAASALAERGINVTVFERNAYLGGKIGAWNVPVGDGEQTVEHGFHAFFRQYYNLNGFLDRLGVLKDFRTIEDYVILHSDLQPQSYGSVETVPALNILDLGRRGFYRWRDVVRKRTRQRLDSFVRFDMERTYEDFDTIPFGRFCEEADLPPELRLSFRTFARAFFSDEADLSTADVLRAFHFYYLSHDHGLLYDYPAGDYETTLLAPIRSHLQANGAELRLNSPVSAIERGTGKRFRIRREEYDWVVLAADIPGMQSIVEGSAWLRELHPDFVTNMHALRTSHGYAVWRIWVDRDVRAGLPTFINVDRKRVLDSVTLYHRVTDEAAAWVDANGGAVLELHSYALPRDIDGDAEVRRVFLEELNHYFPELEGLVISDEVLQVRRDFPAFAPGQHAHRPAPELPIQGLLMAGDWVRLPYPMTHMEAAFVSGILCANVVFRDLGLREETIFTVAPRGLLAPRSASAGRPVLETP
jgi:isorenieratene synthase